MPSTVRAVLFDLDGTLIDHDSAAATAVRQALEGFGVFDHAEVRRFWRNLEDDAMARYPAGDLTFTGQRRLRATALAADLDLGDPFLFPWAGGGGMDTRVGVDTRVGGCPRRWMPA